MLLGIAAAIGTVFSWSAGTFTFLRAARIIQPALLNRARLLIGLCVVATLACVVHVMFPWDLLLRPQQHQWLFLGLSGLVGFAIGDYFGFSSLRVLGARRQSVISTISPAFAAIGGFLFLSERLTLIGIGGMTLSMLGVMWAMSGTHERDAVHAEGYGAFTTGILMAIAGAACQGIGLVLAKMGLQGGVPPLHANFMRMSAGFVGAYIFDLVRRDLKHPIADAFKNKEGARAMYLGTLFGPVIGVSCSLYAISVLDVAVAQTIFSMVPVVIIATAAIRQHEKLRPASIIGAVVAIAGVLVLIYST